jgi:hypothetical protein
MTNYASMEQRVLELARWDRTDEQTAATLTQEGYRSPRQEAVLPSTVKAIRLQHRVLTDRRQSHPRRIPGKLTVP